ncbi:MAG: hypothetical protein ACTSU5_05210 [Promethearchaeota archaeon]
MKEVAAAYETNVVKKPSVKKVVLFKHGVAYFVLASEVTGSARIVMQFKDREMDDILKSLFAVDVSGKGYISTISYDASQDVEHLLKQISTNLPASNKMLEDFLADLKGAPVSLTIAGEELRGSIIGVDYSENANDDWIETTPQLVLLEDSSRAIREVALPEIRSIKIDSPDLNTDLEFFLDATISRKQKDAKNLVIHCEIDGEDTGTREVYTSYIQEAPAWKTSYRLVLPGNSGDSDPPKGKAYLSGWGLVENQTQNDWEEVDLTLVTGLPVTFRYLIYDPQFITRKVVPLPTKTTIGPGSIEEATTGGFEDYADAGFGGEVRRARQETPAPLSVTSQGVRGGAGGEILAALEKVARQTASTSTKDLGELSEYHIEKPVTIERNKSALVPIVGGEVDAKKVLLYEKTIHPTNPMACVELTNTAGVTLEAGPVTLFMDDTLAGEAMLPYLNKGDTRLLNYALEQAVVVNIEEKVEYGNVHRISIRGNYLYEYYYEDRHYTYKINNKAASAKELYLDHPKMRGYKVRDPPVEPKKTPKHWRFPLDLPPKKGVKFEFVMRHEISSSISVWDIDDDVLTQKIGLYSEREFIDEETLEEFREVARLNGQKSDLDLKKSRLEQEREGLNADQGRLRENLKVLGETAQEKKLKERFVQKLTRQEARYEEIKKEMSAIEKEKKKLDKDIAESFKTLRQRVTRKL